MSWHRLSYDGGGMVTLLGSFNPLAEKVAGLNPKLTALSFRAISRRFHPKVVSAIQPYTFVI